MEWFNPATKKWEPLPDPTPEEIAQGSKLQGYRGPIISEKEAAETPDFIGKVLPTDPNTAMGQAQAAAFGTPVLTRLVTRTVGTEGPQAALPAGNYGAAGGGGSRTTTVKHGRPVDKEMLAEQDTADRQRVEEMRGTAEREQELIAQRGEVVRRQLEDMKTYRDRYGEMSAEILADHKAAAAALKKARDELNSMKVDPERFWNALPNTQKVLMAIGTAFAAGGEVASGGAVPNSLGRWLDKSIERDIQLQGEEYKRKLVEVEMDGKERDKLWNNWIKSEDMVRNAALSSAQLELASISLLSDDNKTKDALQKSIYQLGQERRGLAHREFVASQPTVVTTTKVSSGGGGGGGGGGKVPDGAVKRVQEDLSFLRDMNTLMEKYGATDPSRVAALRKIGKDAEFQKELDALIFAKIKKDSGAAFTENEFQRRKNIYSPDVVNGYGPWKSVMGSLYEQTRNSALRTIKQYPGAARSALDEDKRALSRNPFRGK